MNIEIHIPAKAMQIAEVLEVLPEVTEWNKLQKISRNKKTMDVVRRETELMDVFQKKADYIFKEAGIKTKTQRKAVKDARTLLRLMKDYDGKIDERPSMEEQLGVDDE